MTLPPERWRSSAPRSGPCEPCPHNGQEQAAFTSYACKLSDLATNTNGRIATGQGLLIHSVPFLMNDDHSNPWVEDDVTDDNSSCTYQPKAEPTVQPLKAPRRRAVASDTASSGSQQGAKAQHHMAEPLSKGTLLLVFIHG